MHNIPLLLGNVCRLCDPNVCVYSFNIDFNVGYGGGERTKLYDITDSIQSDDIDDNSQTLSDLMTSVRVGGEEVNIPDIVEEEEEEVEG